MSRKNNLFEDLNIDKGERDLSDMFDIDIQTVKRKVNDKLDASYLDPVYDEHGYPYRMYHMYNERKSIAMKSNAGSNVRSKKKILLAAAVATLALGTTAFAAGGIISNWYGSSSSIPDYKSLPTEEQVVKDVGHEAVLINEFGNGYTFKDGNIVNNDLADEDGNSVEKFKSLSFEYEKDGDRVIFSQDKFDSEMGMYGDVIKTVGDTDLYYFSYTNKFVPADYEMTDEDKKAEESGELVFSYGSDKVKVSEVQSVTWVKDGVQYQLMQIDGKLSPDDLAEMAEEVLSK